MHHLLENSDLEYLYDQIRYKGLVQIYQMMASIDSQIDQHKHPSSSSPV